MAPDVRRPIDRFLLFFALMLISVGTVWVYSASAFKSSGVSTTFLVKQLIGVVIGITVMLVLSQSNILALRENPKALVVVYGLTVVLLASTFFFPAVNKAHRWIRYGGFQFQPSEMFKPLAVLIVAWWMVHHAKEWGNRQDSLPKLFTLAGILLLPLGLILKEPDFGTTFLVIFVAMLLVWLGGAPKWIFAVAIPALVGVGAAFVMMAPYRRDRVMSFLNPDADPLGKGLQGIQSLIAVGNGGVLGVGLGGSMQKLNYLPEAHTDFIYAVIAEEAGLVGTSVVLALFSGILWRGFRIAKRVRDPFLRLCATGFTLLLVVQAFMNMSVVLSLAPNKGIPLPFISYGPSSLMMGLATLGLLLAVSKQVPER